MAGALSPRWLHVIRGAHSDARARDEALVSRWVPREQPQPRIPESRKYWWILRPYGRRFLAWDVLGVIVVLLHALGMLLWYGEHNAKLHNHRRCVAGGLGPSEHIPTLDHVVLLSPATMRHIRTTVSEALHAAVYDPSIPTLSLATSTFEAHNASTPERRAGGFVGWLRAHREERWRTERALGGLECSGRCVDAAMDVVTGIVEGPPPARAQRTQPAWVSLALRLSDRWLNRARRKVCRHLHPDAPTRGSIERACAPRLPRSHRRKAAAVAELALTDTQHAISPAEPAAPIDKPRRARELARQRVLARRGADHRACSARRAHCPRCVDLHPPPHCGRMCVLTDRLRIASDVYNVLNLLLVFITAYRIPKRVDRTATRRLSFLERLGRARARSSSTTMHADAMPEGASVRDRALADVVATGGERGERGGGDGGGDEMNEKALSDESVELAPQREYTYEFSPHAIVLHRLTRPYFLLQLLLAFPSYTLVVHAAGVYAPQHAVTSRLRERLLSRVKADPAGAVRFLVRTGLAANFAKIVRGVKLILLLMRRVTLVLKLRSLGARMQRTYAMLQRRVALKRRVRNNWARIRAQRQQLVAGHRSVMRRLTASVGKAVFNLARSGASAAPPSTRLGRASLAVLRSGRRALMAQMQRHPALARLLPDPRERPDSEATPTEPASGGACRPRAADLALAARAGHAEALSALGN